MKDATPVKKGGTPTLWSAKGANEVISAFNALTGMRVIAPLRLDKTDAGWVFSLDEAAAEKAGIGGSGSGDTVFWNTPQSYTANCTGGTTGSFSITLGAKTIGSQFSVGDANTWAQLAAQAYAENNLVCTPSTTSINGRVSQILRRSDGKIVICGRFTKVQGYSRLYLAVLNSDLTLDKQSFSFLPVSLGVDVIQACLDASDRLYVAGFQIQQPCNMPWLQFGQFDPSGGVVGDFYTPSWAVGYISGFYPQSFGSGVGVGSLNCCAFDSVGSRVLFGGGFDTYQDPGGPHSAANIVAVSPTAAFDGSFTSALVSSPVTWILPDGAGGFIVRNGGTVDHITSTGSISGAWNLAGGGWTFFGPDTYCMAMQGSNVIVVGNISFTKANGSGFSGFGRAIGSTGAIDHTWYWYNEPTVGLGQGIFTNALCVAVQTDNKILVGGTFAGGLTNYIARCNPDGDPDLSWTTSADALVTAITVEPGGNILVGGEFSTIGGVSRSKLARLNSAGVVL